MNQEYVDIIKAECAKYGVDANLFCAIVNQESSWNPNAVRYENKFVYFWEPKKNADRENITIDSETVLQKFSYGLCQIMGSNLRWIGYSEPLMTAIEPKINLHYGVLFFSKRCNKYVDIKDKISAYNIGTPQKVGEKYINQGYVDKVYSFYQSLKPA